MAQPIDKKKMAIIGLLGVSLLGVGVWQFTGSGPEEAKFKEVPKTDGNQANGEEVVGEPAPDLLAGLTRKDPFVPGHLPGELAAGPVVRQPNQSAPTYTQPVPRTQLQPWGAGLSPLGGGNGAVTTEPAAAMQPANEFDLVGVVDGPHPVAVFRSGSGTQKMVYLYGSVSQGVRVTQISHGQVTVSQNGKTKTLIVGGNSQ